MLQQILEPASLEGERAPYRDPVLIKELYDHFSRVFPTVAPEDLKAADIARQFGHQVLIQPALLGDAQERHTVALNKTDPRCGSGGECTDYVPSIEQRLEEFAEVLRDPDAHSRFLGVDMTSIAWHRAAERGTASPGMCIDESALEAALGSLPDCHVFFAPHGEYFMGARHVFGDAPGSPIAPMVLHNLKYVRTFITDAAEDSGARGDALVLAFGEARGVVSAAVSDSKAGRELIVTLASGAKQRVRYPSYPVSGHTVSLYQPEELHRDVESWYLDSSAIARPSGG